MGDFLRAVGALPSEKRDWTPGAPARSALDQLKEVAFAPQLYRLLIAENRMPSPEEHSQMKSEVQSIEGFDKICELAMKNTSELCNHIAEFPNDQLEKEVTLPFGGGMTVTMADVLAIHYWNTVYHQGQVNFIQMLLGDGEMH